MQARRDDDPQAEAAQAAARLALDRMYEGGIYDHLRGGFARYAVDREWLVPHFEKMLDVNAQLLPLYAEAVARWPDAEHLRVVVRETLDYLVEDMRADDGRFFTSTDADSQGEEGLYFTWTPGLREPPLRDEKLLVAGNALLASGLARTASAAAAWGDPDIAVRATQLAQDLMDAVYTHHVAANGNVLRVAFGKAVAFRGVLDDVGLLARACLDLHELTLGPVWHERAAELAAHAMRQYAREEGDGFYFTAADAEALIERSECMHDASAPTGLAAMIEVLARLDAVDAAPPGARQLITSVLDRFRAAPSQPFAYASLIAAAMIAGPEARFVKLLGPAPDDRDSIAWATGIRSARLDRPWPVHLAYVAAPKVSAVLCVERRPAPLWASCATFSVRCEAHSLHRRERKRWLPARVGAR